MTDGHTPSEEARDRAELVARWLWRQKNKDCVLKIRVAVAGRGRKSMASMEGRVTDLVPVGAGPEGKSFVRYLIRIGDHGSIWFSPHELVRTDVVEWAEDDEVTAMALRFRNTDYEIVVRDPQGRTMEQFKTEMAARKAAGD